MTSASEQKPINWLNILGVIGGIVTILGGVFAVYAYFNPINPSKKELIIRLTVQSPIIKDEIANGLEFSVNGVVTNNVYLNEFEVVNSGNEPILKDDFYEMTPTVVNFGKVCKIVSTSVEARPDNFRRRLKYSSQGGKVVIQPTLLNPGDFAKFKVTTAGCGPTFLPTADIEGIPEISKDWTTEEYKRPIWVFILFAIGVVGWFYFVSSVLRKRLKLRENLTAIIGSIVPSVIYTALLVYDGSPEIVSQVPAICRDIYDQAKATFELP